MELFAHLADAGGEAALDAHVDILVLHGEYDLAGGNVRPDQFQTGNDLVPLSFGDDALLSQHGHMGDAAVDILVVHPLVKKNGCVVFFHKLIHIFFKSAAP